MNIGGVVSLLTGLSGFALLVLKVARHAGNRPRLEVKIESFRPDDERKRLVFRTSVLNFGRVVASKCEGFWTLFNPALREVSSGTGIFWAPEKDNDHDFQIREFRSATIEFNERRFCWAELDITNESVEGTTIHLFPYDSERGLYLFALVIEYGRYKSFDFVGINVPGRIPASVPVEEAIEKIAVHWKHRLDLRGWWRRVRMKRFIARQDYHNHLRPT